jgi:hypothetical protein
LLESLNDEEEEKMVGVGQQEALEEPEVRAAQ